jgi:hypothetical protein
MRLLDSRFLKQNQKIKKMQQLREELLTFPLPFWQLTQEKRDNYLGSWIQVLAFSLFFADVFFKYNFENWYDEVKDHTFKTRIIPLSVDVSVVVSHCAERLQEARVIYKSFKRNRAQLQADDFALIDDLRERVQEAVDEINPDGKGSLSLISMIFRSIFISPFFASAHCMKDFSFVCRVAHRRMLRLKTKSAFTRLPRKNFACLTI